MAIQTTQGAFVIDGVHTELLVSDYSNRVLLVATQIGKLGTMFHAEGPRPESGGEGGEGAVSVAPPEVRTLVGKHDDEMLTVAARRLAQIVQGSGVRKPVLISLGLKAKLEVGTLRGVVRVAGDFCCEALGLSPPSQSMAEMSIA